jgi:hypothetical protein
VSIHAPSLPSTSILETPIHASRDLARDVIGAIQDVAGSAVDSAEHLIPRRNRRTWVKPVTVGAVVVVVVAFVIVLLRSGGDDERRAADETSRGSDRDTDRTSHAARQDGRATSADTPSVAPDRVGAPIPE